MTYKQTSKITDILYAIAVIISIIGVVFKILDLPNSTILLVLGVSSAAILGFNEVKRLKKVINVLTETLQ